MGKAKRLRKENMHRRRERAHAAFRKRLEELTARHSEQVERAKLRRSLLESDLPEPARDLLGMLVDPIGAANELVERELRKKHH
jgi:hypothetical protein